VRQEGRAAGGDPSVGALEVDEQHLDAFAITARLLERLRVGEALG
jgi:hypothetical protein